MRVPEPLSTAFGKEFQERISRFAVGVGLMDSAADIESKRFLTRSVIPHVGRLSDLFNRRSEEILEEIKAKGKRDPKTKAKAAAKQAEGLDKYWKETSNPANTRLAYFLYFMPPNLYRIASIWSELARLGFRWQAKGNLKAIELGAGPATGACGIATGERFAPVGLPKSGDWALIEQDKATLDLGAKWAAEWFSAHPEQAGDWGTRTFHRTIDFTQGLLPPGAPRFNLWLMSFFLNESRLPPAKLARALVDAWERHLDEEGVVILCEPALKQQSRRLLELRRELIKLHDEGKAPWLQILLPCLGHQACGALAAPEDWCHEEVSWWRPPYFRTIDDMAGLDRRTLPFSYLVITRSKRSRAEILPAIAQRTTERLVSPAHKEGRDLEFFICGQEGKRRARIRPEDKDHPTADLNRGDVLLDADIRGDVHSSRIQSVKKIG